MCVLIVVRARARTRKSSNWRVRSWSYAGNGGATSERESFVIIWVDDQLFKPGAAPDVDRLALLRNAYHRRHTLLVSISPERPFTAPNRPSFEAWSGGLPAPLTDEVCALCETLSRVSANAVTRGARRLHVCRTPGESTDDGWQVSLPHAVRIAALPVFVLVENIVNEDWGGRPWGVDTGRGSGVANARARPWL